MTSSKLRGKQLVSRIRKTHRYETQLDGIRILAAHNTLMGKIIKPLLAGTNTVPIQQNTPDEINNHYQNMQREMSALFEILGIAA